MIKYIGQRFLLFALSIVLLSTGFKTFANEPVISVIGKYLCIDYKPFFPIGLYAFPDNRSDDAIWKEAADAGFNFVLSDQSGKHGIYVSRRIPWKNVDGRRVSLMELYRDESMLGELKQFIAENEDDTTMICWHAPDEPCWFGPSANSLQLGYEAIKANSNKPVWLNVGPSFTEVWHYSKPRDFFRTADILSEDIYPIPDGKPKHGQGYNRYAYYVGEYTRKLVDLGSIDGVQSTPIWMVLQGFGWGDLTSFDNPSDFVPPTMHELRYMSYDAIVNGATGILWWGVHRNTSIRYWEKLKAMASELRDLTYLWTCPFELVPEKLDVTYQDPDTDDPLRWLIKVHDDDVYILAVNTRPVPLKNVTFNLVPGGKLTKVNDVFDENRSMHVLGGNSWTDDFEGYGVQIYKTDIYFSFMRRYFDDPVSQN